MKFMSLFCLFQSECKVFLYTAFFVQKSLFQNKEFHFLSNAQMCDLTIGPAYILPASSLLSSPLHTKPLDYKYQSHLIIGLTLQTHFAADMREIKSWSFWRAVAAEFVGMLLFIFFGLLSVVGHLDKSIAAKEVKVSLAFALAIATLAQSLGHVSGAHLNPAVTLGLLVSCQISALRCVGYILAQMLGAVAASAIVNGINSSKDLGVNALAVPVAQGFIIEFLGTLQLVLCVIAVTDNRRRDVTGSAPLAIGLSVGLGHFAAISLTGCGINPARSFGPAIIHGTMKNHWVYWLGPMCGGIAAALIYDFLLYPRTTTLRSRRNILLHGQEDEDDVGLIEGGNSSPGPSQGPSQWPK